MLDERIDSLVQREGQVIAMLRAELIYFVTGPLTTHPAQRRNGFESPDLPAVSGELLR